MNFKTYILQLCLICSTLLLGACNSKEDLTLFMFAEATDMQGGSSHTLMCKGVPYERGPIMSLRHFDRYKSFMETQDGSYGVIIYAKKEFVKRYYAQTASRVGKRVIIVMNGLFFTPQRIHAPISHGMIYIKNGLNGYDLKCLGDHLKPADPKSAEMEEKRKLDKNPRPLPKATKQKQQQRDYMGRTIPELMHSR